MDKFWDGCLIDGDCLQAESFEEIPNDSSVQEAYVVSKQQCKKNIERALLEGV